MSTVKEKHVGTAAATDQGRNCTQESKQAHGPEEGSEEDSVDDAEEDHELRVEKDDGRIVEAVHDGGTSDDINHEGEIRGLCRHHRPRAQLHPRAQASARTGRGRRGRHLRRRRRWHAML